MHLKKLIMDSCNLISQVERKSKHCGPSTGWPRSLRFSSARASFHCSITLQHINELTQRANHQSWMQKNPVHWRTKWTPELIFENLLLFTSREVPSGKRVWAGGEEVTSICNQGPEQEIYRTLFLLKCSMMKICNSWIQMSAQVQIHIVLMNVT